MSVSSVRAELRLLGRTDGGEQLGLARLPLTPIFS